MIFVLLAAFNEERALRALLPELNAALKNQSESHRLVVVDDGSKDGTPKLLSDLSRTLPLQVLTHSDNKGYAAALKTGYSHILDLPNVSNSVIVSLDADGTHRPEYILALIQKLHEGWDIVTASYRMPGGQSDGLPLSRQWMSVVVNKLFKIFSPVTDIETYTNGFRAYRAEILQKVRNHFGNPLIEEDGFAGGTELFLKAVFCRGRATEIPFHLYYDRRGKESKIRFIPTICGYLKLIQRAHHFK